MRERGPSPPPLGPQETLGGGVGHGIHQPSCAFDRRCREVTKVRAGMAQQTMPRLRGA
jgi:hypothetical protein